MPTARPFTVSPVLTGIAIGYSNPAQTLIADKVLPRVQVAGESFKWLEYPLAEGFTAPDAEVGRRGRVARVEFESFERDGSTTDYGLESPIPQSDIKSAAAQRQAGVSNYDPQNHAAQSLANLLMLQREARVARLVQDPNNYAARSRFALLGDQRFSAEASDPVGGINAAIDSVLVFRPNTIVMGFSVWQKLRSHKKLINAVKGGLTSEGMITREQFAALFEIQNLHVGESYVNAAARGQNPNLVRTWSNAISLLYIDPTADARSGVTWGLTAQFGSRIGGTVNDPNIGLEGGIIVRVGEKLRELTIAKDAGALIQNAVA